MSQTITSTQTSQFHLFKIITIAQDKLQQNFQHIISRLNNNEKQLTQSKIIIDELTQKLQKLSSTFEQKLNLDSKHSIQLIQVNEIEIKKLKNEVEITSKKVEKNQNQFQQFSKIYENMKLFIDRDFQARNIQCDNFKNKIHNIQIQLKSMQSLLTQKEDIKQTNRIKFNYNQLVKQIRKLEQQNKFVQFKLDKFQLHNQKNQKIQMNKQFLLMKDIQEKIKDQLKVNIINQKLPLNNIENINNQEKRLNTLTHQQIKQNSISNLVNPTQQNVEKNINKKRESLVSMQNNQNMQRLINQINQTLLNHERKLQRSQNQIKHLYEQSQGNQKNKKSVNNQIEQKLIALKPQLNKLWGKCDALEDKATFMQKKMEEKNKQINNIFDILKQNQYSKFDEKIKNLQTQIFANLKQIRGKVDGKTSLNEFQKFTRTTLQRMQSLNQQVILKSDKLQVKKALLFLQSKIKQIILVISQQEENQKDALITKKQIKCISCDKDVQKFLGTANNMKGNWDSFPLKQHSSDVLGRFGMKNYGSLARKLKKMDHTSKQNSSLANKRNKQSIHSQSDPKIDFN